MPRKSQGYVNVNASVHPDVKALLEELAATRYTTVSGLITQLALEEQRRVLESKRFFIIDQEKIDAPHGTD